MHVGGRAAGTVVVVEAGVCDGGASDGWGGGDGSDGNGDGDADDGGDGGGGIDDDGCRDGGGRWVETEVWKGMSMMWECGREWVLNLCYVGRFGSYDGHGDDVEQQ